jgi:GNAT superfamily N-acetyltransferase
MIKIRILPPTKKDIRWAIKQDFIHLPPVDTAFAPENLGWFRRLLLRYIIFPAKYRNRLKGLILHLNDQRAGYIFTGMSLTAMEIETLVIEPEFRRKGYANRLLNHVEGIALEEEREYVSARMPPENGPANAFFRKHGFKSYRAEIWEISDVSSLEATSKGASLQKLPATQILETYRRWMGEELKHGDAWAEDLIISDHPRMAFRARGHHWTCLLDGEEKGYLRVSVLRGGVEVYLAASPSMWEEKIQVSWIKQAIEASPSPFKAIKVYLGSGGHFNSSQKVFMEAGFKSAHRPRYLLAKPLSNTN